MLEHSKFLALLSYPRTAAILNMSLPQHILFMPHLSAYYPRLMSPQNSITDHFEILSKTPSSILIRCGDSPLNSGLRDTDGLFELGVKVVEEPITGWSGTLGAKERFVEFSLKR